MREQVVQADRALVLRHVVEEALERVVDRELPALREQEDRRGRELLGERADVEDRVRLVHPAVHAVGQPGGGAQQDLVSLGDQHRARETLLGQRVEARAQRGTGPGVLARGEARQQDRPHPDRDQHGAPS